MFLEGRLPEDCIRWGLRIQDVMHKMHSILMSRGTNERERAAFRRASVSPVGLTRIKGRHFCVETSNQSLLLGALRPKTCTQLYNLTQPPLLRSTGSALHACVRLGHEASAGDSTLLQL